MKRPHLVKMAALALALFAGALAGRDAAANTVLLKDGRIVKGDVIERPDGRIEISRPGKGALVVDKADIVRNDPDPAPAAKAAVKRDTVLTTDGRAVVGTVTLSDDGNIIVKTDKGEGETRIPRDQIKSIQFRTGQVVNGQLKQQGIVPDDDFDRKWRAQIDTSIEALRSPNSNDKDRKKARKELIELGPFARKYIEDSIAAIQSNSPQSNSPDGALVLAVLQEVIKVADIKKVVTTQMEEHIADLCEKLVDHDAVRREEAIKAAVVQDAEDAPPLLLWAVTNDPEPRVRGMCLSQLAMLNRYEELGKVLKLEKHEELRFTAALYLGEAGVYAGIPVLIEALELERPGSEFIRKTAIDKLAQYTGKGNLGYLPDDDDKERRKAAVERWNTWWTAEGAAFVKAGDRIMDPRREVTPQDEQQALDLWRDGNKKLEDVAKREKDASEKVAPFDPKERRAEYETAAYLFGKSLQADPGFVAARLSRAIILYEQLRNPREAERELLSVVKKFSGEAKYPKVLANHHLARLKEQEGDWEKAHYFHDQTTRLDPDFLDGYIGAGDCRLEAALAWMPGPPEAGGAGGGSKDAPPKDETKEPKDPPSAEPPKDGEKKDGEKKDEKPPEKANPADEMRSTRERLLREASQHYRIALDVIERKSDALLHATTDLGTDQTGEVINMKQGILLSTIRNSKESLTKTAASVWFRMGRVHVARDANRDPSNPDAVKKSLAVKQEAVAAFRAARTLQPEDERYRAAAEFWEKQLEIAGKEEAPKEAPPK